MAIRLGPILHAGRSDETTWRFSIHLTIDDPNAGDRPPWTIGSSDTGVSIGAPRLVADFRDLNQWSVWAWPVEAERGVAERSLSYQLVDASGRAAQSVDHVMIPKKGGLPRIALFSCNGFSSAEEGRDMDEPGRMWQVMASRHECGIDCAHPDDPSGLHLLIGSGDQLYADGIPTLADETHGLYGLSRKQLKRKQESATRDARAQREYLELYGKVWTHDEVSAMMSRVPGIYTWDDHEIMDGWGSHRDHIQDNVAYRAVYRAARKAFLAFQLAGDPTEQEPPPLVSRTPGGDHLLQTLSFREADRWVDIVALDLRSNRTRDTVMSAAQWLDLKAWLRRYEQDAGATDAHRHLLLVSSIPVVYLRFRAANFVLGSVIPGDQRIEDDLLDQWEHRRHQGERDRLIMTLLDIRKTTGAQVTILSGDVHVAAHGRIVSTHGGHLRKGESQVVIHQIISSGIVHPPPSLLLHKGVELFGSKGPSEISDGVFSEMLDMDTQQSRLRARNFATLGFDDPESASDQGRMWVEWVVEDDVRRRQVVVNPAG